MKHISLFSGIGGFDLAATWAGWENIVSCEINPFCRKVLQYYWPDAYHHDDIKTLTNEKITEKLGQGWIGADLVISGGFPCQPYSEAGLRKGKDDPRHLWPEMLRVIRELRPRWVVGENVRGLVSWSGGMVFEEVHSDLEAEGYQVQAFILPACGIGAPHRRDRVWFVSKISEGRWESISSSADSDSVRASKLQKEFSTKKNNEFANVGGFKGIPYGKLQRWETFPSKPAIFGGDDGLSARLDGITVSKWRNESASAYGNAIVPQVAYQIFKAINEYEEQARMGLV